MLEKFFFPPRPDVARPVAGDDTLDVPFDPAQLREIIMRYGTTVASRLALSLLDLLGEWNVDNVEISSPRSSVG